MLFVYISILFDAFQCFRNAFSTLFDAFSYGFEVSWKIYLGFLTFFRKVNKNTKNEFFGAGCPPGWSGQIPRYPLSSPQLTEVRALNEKMLSSGKEWCDADVYDSLYKELLNGAL